MCYFLLFVLTTAIGQKPHIYGHSHSMSEDKHVRISGEYTANGSAVFDPIARALYRKQPANSAVDPFQGENHRKEGKIPDFSWREQQPSKKTRS